MILSYEFVDLNLIRPSYTIRAPIFEKVFRLEKFSKTDLLPLLPPLQAVQLNKKEGKSCCIGGAKYAAKEYLPPLPKMSGATFHFNTTSFANYVSLIGHQEVGGCLPCLFYV